MTYHLNTVCERILNQNQIEKASLKHSVFIIHYTYIGTETYVLFCLSSRYLHWTMIGGNVKNKIKNVNSVEYYQNLIESALNETKEETNGIINDKFVEIENINDDYVDFLCVNENKSEVVSRYRLINKWYLIHTKESDKNYRVVLHYIPYNTYLMMGLSNIYQLSDVQRQYLLKEINCVYQEKFQSTDIKKMIQGITTSNKIQEILEILNRDYFFLKNPKNIYKRKLYYDIYLESTRLKWINLKDILKMSSLGIIKRMETSLAEKWMSLYLYSDWDKLVGELKRYHHNSKLIKKIINSLNGSNVNNKIIFYDIYILSLFFSDSMTLDIFNFMESIPIIKNVPIFKCLSRCPSIKKIHYFHQEPSIL